MQIRISLFVLVAACAHAASSTPIAPAPAAVAPVTPTPDLVAPMAKLGFMRGVWSGPASGIGPGGTRYTVTQTERMGPMLGGDIVVIEGRGYRDDGSTGFNAFAVASWNAGTQKYELRSYAMGYAGTFELVLTPDGYTWETPAGPDAVMHYTATIKDGHWREVGEYRAAGKPPVPSFEMNLTRRADTDWPLGTPISPK